MDLDDRALQRWLSLEMGRVAEGLVRTPGWLLELLRAPAPGALTRGGRTHLFDRAALARESPTLAPFVLA